MLSVAPENSTIPENSHLIIQCKASSATPLQIWWFKQTEGQETGIKYFNKYYFPINNSDQFYPVPGEVNLYLSKLSIYNAREVDSGVYACAAISNSGLAYKIAVVRVTAAGAAWYAEWEVHTSFLLLFLIPLLLALIPVTVWLCYYRRKKRDERRQGEGRQQERKLIRTAVNSEVL